MMIVSNKLGSWQAWRRLLMSSNRNDRDSQMRCELRARRGGRLDVHRMAATRDVDATGSPRLLPQCEGIKNLKTAQSERPRPHIRFPSDFSFSSSLLLRSNPL